MKWVVSFLATFDSHIRLVFRLRWTGQALAAAWGLFQIGGGECLRQSFGKGFFNKFQVCPVASQEPALASGGWPCRWIFWGCVLMAGIPNCQKCGAWDLCIGSCWGVPQLYGSLGQEVLLWEAAGTWPPCLTPKCSGKNLVGFFFVHE